MRSLTLSFQESVKTCLTAFNVSLYSPSRGILNQVHLFEDFKRWGHSICSFTIVWSSSIKYDAGHSLAISKAQTN